MAYDFADKVFGGAVAIVVAFVLWLVRSVFTNAKKVELLEREIKQRDKTREEDRQYLKEMLDHIAEARQEDLSAYSRLRQDVAQVRRDIQEIFKNHK